MKKLMFVVLLGLLLLPPLATHCQQTKAEEPKSIAFLQTNTWWNLYFSKDNNPLLRGSTSINAVKVLEVDKSRLSWIKITFPKSRKEHLSIFATAAESRGDDAVATAEGLAEWEKMISAWRVMWVNLDHVVFATRLEPGGPAKGSDPIRSQTDKPPSAGGSRR